MNQSPQLAAAWQSVRGAGSGERTGVSVGSFSDTAECEGFYSILWSLQSPWPMAAGLVIVNVAIVTELCITCILNGISYLLHSALNCESGIV